MYGCKSMNMDLNICRHALMPNMIAVVFVLMSTHAYFLYDHSLQISKYLQSLTAFEENSYFFHLLVITHTHTIAVNSKFLDLVLFFKLTEKKLIIMQKIIQMIALMTMIIMEFVCSNIQFV